MEEGEKRGGRQKQKQKESARPEPGNGIMAREPVKNRPSCRRWAFILIDRGAACLTRSGNMQCLSVLTEDLSLLLLPGGEE